MYVSIRRWSCKHGGRCNKHYKKMLKSVQGNENGGMNGPSLVNPLIKLVLGGL
jgi:hypothetical protein